jgi:hypothetical protein
MRLSSVTLVSLACTSLVVGGCGGGHADQARWVPTGPTIEGAAPVTPSLSLSTAFDSSRHQLIAGGDRTYLLDDGGWKDIGPLPSSQTFFVFDDALRAVVMLDWTPTGSIELWQWNGRAWSSIDEGAATPTPPARSPGALWYDPRSKALLLFGGLTQSGHVLDDMWSWTDSGWQALAPIHRPPARSGAAAVVDPVTSTTVLFGGFGTTRTLGDTWTWDGADWTHIAAKPAPAARNNPRLLYDPSRREVLLYGGIGGATGQNAPGEDLWAWDGSTWARLIESSNTPSYLVINFHYDDRLRSPVLVALKAEPAPAQYGPTETFSLRTQQ